MEKKSDQLDKKKSYYRYAVRGARRESIATVGGGVVMVVGMIAVVVVVVERKRGGPVGRVKTRWEERSDSSRGGGDGDDLSLPERCRPEKKRIRELKLEVVQSRVSLAAKRCVLSTHTSVRNIVLIFARFKRPARMKTIDTSNLSLRAKGLRT